MKKFLPLIILLVGVLVVVGAFFIIKRDKGEKTSQDETALIELPPEKRPIAKLIPSEDGHWLKLVIERLQVEGAESLDYELLYKLPDERVQGVPGTIKLTGQSLIERDLLLGSESSGKFRYDEGVEEGTLTLRFRNKEGKLMAKLATGFHLQVGDDELTSVDGKFKYELDKIIKGVFFVTMNTFGQGEVHDAAFREGTYAIFASSKVDL